MAYVYRSITLAAGESYVLPAGAELVGVNGSITDEGNCANTANIETLSCYIALIGASVTDNGNSNYGESEQSGGTPYVIQGVYQNGIYTQFTAGPSTGIGGGGLFDALGIGLAIQGIVPGIIDYAGHTVVHTSPSDNGLTYVLIYTVPSLAENLYLWGENTAPLDGSAVSNVTQLLPFRPYSYYESNGYSSLPTCPTSAP